MTEAALDKAPFDINGAKVTPKRATPNVERLKQTKAEFHQSNTMLDAACNGKRSIFVGALTPHLRYSTSEEDLEQYFSGFGRVVRVCKCTVPETGELRRFGFVDFSEYGVVRKVNSKALGWHSEIGPG